MLFIKKIFQKNQYLLFIFIVVFILFAFFVKLPGYAANTKPRASSIVDKSLKSIVWITARSFVRKGDGSCGSGFIADIKNGFIITTANTLSYGVYEYLIRFNNGEKIEAKLLYKDLWLDLGVLKIDSSLIPEDYQEIKFDNNPLQLNQKVYITWENHSYSANVSDLYAIHGEMPQQSYIANLNIADIDTTCDSDIYVKDYGPDLPYLGGSPLLNTQGQACGLIYAAHRGHASVLNGQYITNILKQLAEGKEPIRKHMGAIINLYSLDDAQKHRSFPSQLVKQYLAEFPDASNRILSIFSIVTGSPADGKLQIGDIIWKINGKKCGASLYTFDYEMDNSKSNKIELEIYRDGKPKSITLDLYDVNQNQMTPMLEFGGATFHLIQPLLNDEEQLIYSDHLGIVTGIPMNSLVLGHCDHTVTPMNGLVLGRYENSSVFNLSKYWSYDRRIVIHKIGDFDVYSVKSLIQAIEALNGNRFTTLSFKIYEKQYLKEMGLPQFLEHENITVDIVLRESDFNPTLYTFDKKTLEWNISYPLDNKIQQSPAN